MLGISQPAIHRSLGLLEDSCGATLLQKSRIGTRLTDAGEALLHEVKLAMAQARALESEIAAWRGEIRGRVIVGVLPLSAMLVLPQAIDAFIGRHSKIEITVVDGTYESLTQQLRSADIDLILGALRAEPLADVRQEILFEEELAVIARPGHPCFARRGLTLAQLQDWRWLVPLPGTPAGLALDAAFEARGLARPARGLQATSPLFTRALVARSDRLAIASRGEALEEERAGRLRIVPVALPDTRRRIGVAVRGLGEPSPEIAELLRALREAAASQV